MCLPSPPSKCPPFHVDFRKGTKTNFQGGQGFEPFLKPKGCLGHLLTPFWNPYAFCTPSQKKKFTFFAGAEDGDFFMKGYLTRCTSLPQHIEIAKQAHAGMSTFLKAPSRFPFLGA